MSSIQDAVLGIPGTPLPPAVGQTILNDADAATVFEQVNWLRSSVLVTPTGHLKRRHPRSQIFTTAPAEPPSGSHSFGGSTRTSR